MYGYDFALCGFGDVHACLGRFSFIQGYAAEGEAFICGFSICGGEEGLKLACRIVSRWKDF